MAHRSIDVALDQEILEQLQKDGTPRQFAAWKMGTFHPMVCISYDMGWQKRSSGHKYDSMSGHGMMVGQNTNKVLGYRVKSKDCRTCKKIKNTDKIPTHKCPKNHVGSSKAMEVDSILEMLTDAWDNRSFGISTIVADDDTTMIANLKHSYKEEVSSGMMKPEDWPRTAGGNKKADNGRLPIRVPSPQHKADPSHRKKVIGKRLYALAMLPNSVAPVDKIDAEKIKCCWGYMLSSLRTMDPIKDKKEIVRKAKAVLEHRFNNHRFCDKSWCYYLQSKDSPFIYKRPKSKGYYTKQEEREKYECLKDELGRFMSYDVLCESIHSMTTQKNESLNTSVARLCPKSKHFGSTPTLRTRVQVAICFANMGSDVFYHSVISHLTNGQEYNPYINRMGKKRKQDKARQETLHFKRSRRFKLDAKHKEDVLKERLTPQKGTYSPGIRFSSEVMDM